jgi:hypothetical protein
MRGQPGAASGDVQAEEARLEQARLGQAPWRQWGPYVSERAWATVREDYSADGSAWDYFPHDQARSKAYRWGEDGLAGLCDRYQVLVFALALWNGRDPILKERLYGLVPGEGNHGEDVKELYYYLDATPTHSYLKYLYKYPQAEFPYRQLIAENRRRTCRQPEYELLDTGVFDDDRYFDVFVEYAKASPTDVCVRIEAVNRGPQAATLHVLPQLWFRNTWSWGAARRPRPVIRLAPGGAGHCVLLADDRPAGPLAGLPRPYQLGPYFLYAEAGCRPLFTDNESNFVRLYGPQARNPGPYVKDAFHRHIIAGEDCVNPQMTGTKAALHHVVSVPPGGARAFRLRLTNAVLPGPLDDVDAVIRQRRRESDAFYDRRHPPGASADERLVQRQALAGMLWGQQVYLFDVKVWREGDDPANPPPALRRQLRNVHWDHLNSMRVLTMPDKWEYPWFAAWDLAFQCLPLALVDPELAKEQLWLLLFEQFQHPNGQVPAYEWEFSDLNPPVHAWAVWRVYMTDRARTGRADRRFLEKCFHKLLINFAWWVNRVDAEGLNVFEGGFLGLDNITLIDRSLKQPGGAVLKQADATGWMGLFCLNLMRIALELGRENAAYQGLATKFFEHFVYIGAAMKHMGGRQYELWSNRDGFFYDVLRHADGEYHKFRVRSVAGLIPLFAIETLDEAELEGVPEFRTDFGWFLANRAGLTAHCVATVQRAGRPVHLLTLLDKAQLGRVLACVWSPDEFRGPHGLRSLSKYHEAHPFRLGGNEVGYEAGETASALKGGNSNWRGPVWLPTTFLMIEALRRLAEVYGCSLAVDGPAGEGPATLAGMARSFADRVISLFIRGPDGRRPVHGDALKYRDDPHWRDLVLFYEYFHGDTGAGLGASHQTGWTGLVATLIDEWRR